MGKSSSENLNKPSLFIHIRPTQMFVQRTEKYLYINVVIMKTFICIHWLTERNFIGSAGSAIRRIGPQLTRYSFNKICRALHFFENLILSDIWMTHDTLRKRQFSTQANMKEGNIKNKGTQGKISFCLSSKCFIIQYLSRFQYRWRLNKC